MLAVTTRGRCCLNVGVESYKAIINGIAAHFCYCDSQEEHCGDHEAQDESKETLSTAQATAVKLDCECKFTVTGSLQRREGTHAGPGQLREGINTISKWNQIRRSYDGTSVRTLAVKCLIKQ